MRASPFESQPRAKPSEPIQRGPHYDWEGEARRLWLEGKSDAEVAKITGCGVTYAGKMRRAMGIMKHQLRAAETKRIDPEKLRRLYAAGLNDEQIARARGTNATIARKWRLELKLPPNGHKVKNPDRVREIYRSIMEEGENGDLQ